MSLRTPLSRARGLGSAKDGFHHWWVQRITSIALIPLTLWLVASLVGLAGADHATVTAWLAQPVVAVLMVLLVVAALHHAQLGLQVVYEDYIHVHWLRITIDVATKLAVLLLGAASVFAVLRIAFGG